jgi:hypothetical protein
MYGWMSEPYFFMNPGDDCLKTVPGPKEKTLLKFPVLIMMDI